MALSSGNLAVGQSGKEPRVWVGVPAKGFREAKSRLASVLGPGPRAELARRLLWRTLAVLREVPELSRVLVISHDEDALTLAGAHRAYPLRGDGPLGLNAAVRQAAAFAAEGADALLVLAADLPLLEPDDVRELLRLGQHHSIVMAPDQRRVGTNALYLSPPQAIQPGFGSTSFEFHQRRARSAGFDPLVFENANIGFDLDLPEDLARLLELEPAWRDLQPLAAAEPA